MSKLLQKWMTMLDNEEILEGLIAICVIPYLTGITLDVKSQGQRFPACLVHSFSRIFNS